MIPNTPSSGPRHEYIPIVGTHRTGPPREFIEAGYPFDFGDTLCKLPREGDLYALKMDESLLHWIGGDFVILDPNKIPSKLKTRRRPHGEVYLRTKDHSREGLFRVVDWISETWETAWIVENILEANNSFHIPVENIEILHPIIAVAYSGLLSERH